MKKIAVILLLVFCLAGPVFAQEESALDGLSVGLRIQFWDITDVEKDPPLLSFRPWVAYERLFGPIGMKVEMGVPFGLKEQYNDDFWLGFDFNLGVGVGLNISSASTMTFSVDYWFYKPFQDFMLTSLGPGFWYSGNDDGIEMWLTTGANYWQGLNSDTFRDIQIAIEMPFIVYDEIVLKAFDRASFSTGFNLGLKSGFGFGVKAYHQLRSWDGKNMFFYDVDFSVEYGIRPLFAMLLVNVPFGQGKNPWGGAETNTIKTRGIRIQPMVEYELNSNLLLGGNISLSNAGSENKLRFGAAIFVRYKF